MEFKIFNSRIRLNKAIVILLGSLLAVILAITGYLLMRGGNGVIIETGAEGTGGVTSGTVPGVTALGTASTKAAETATASNPSDGASSSGTTNLQEIKVYVTGAVNKPGIVTLLKGQIIDDAIRAAGGVTKDADLENINLVYELNQNLMIYIVPRSEASATGAADPQPGLAKGNAALKGVSKASVIPAGSEEAGQGTRIIRDSGGAVVISSGDLEEQDGKININTADAAELDKLPGIGAATAQDIISYREKNGPFKRIEDIMKVPGIKESRFARLKDLISVG